MKLCRGRLSKGVISLELALIAPLVVLTFLAIIQLGYLAAVRLVAETAAMSAARVSVVRPDPRAAFLAANKVTLAVLRKPCLSSSRFHKDHITVDVILQIRPFIPGLDRMFGSRGFILISASKTMIKEPVEES